MGGGVSKTSSQRNLYEGEKMSYYRQAKQGYNELVNAIIRPPRADYTDEMLGPKKFLLQGRPCRRFDFDMANFRNQILKCSFFYQEDLHVSAPRPCVVYLHGNSSCRLEALDIVPTVLSQGMTLFSFDFSGSGRSDGEFISLGWFERDDVSTVVEYLRKDKRVSTIALWGRSMGASTALMCAQRDPSIACLILDSPFISLNQLARELVENSQVQVPKFAITLALKFIRNSVKSRAKFDINKIEPIKYCPSSFIPALFGAAEHDSFIPPSHAKTLCEKYAGDKNLIIFPGTHNTRRDKFFFTSVSIFLYERLVKPSGATSAFLEYSDIDKEFSDYGVSLKPSVYNPLEESRDRSGIGGQTDLCLLKTAMVDEDEEMLKEALALSLKEYQEQQILVPSVQKKGSNSRLASVKVKKT